jgi:hypothetical protein
MAGNITTGGMLIGKIFEDSERQDIYAGIPLHERCI